MAQKRHLGTDDSTASSSVAAEDVYEDSDDESEMTIRTKAARYIRQGLYYVTDSEKFRPPRKKPKYVIPSVVCSFWGVLISLVSPYLIRPYFN